MGKEILEILSKNLKTLLQKYSIIPKLNSTATITLVVKATLKETIKIKLSYTIKGTTDDKSK